MGWLEGSISRSSLQFHFLQTLEHRTDVSVTSTSPWWEAPEEQEHWTPTFPCPMCSQDLAVLGCGADVLQLAQLFHPVSQLCSAPCPGVW
uniref:Uncharacterized protein n=1 Tax=Serinus canaria TaxID=9135 RepID=A0A8C9NCT7_SERCA